MQIKLSREYFWNFKNEWKKYADYFQNDNRQSSPDTWRFQL